MGRLPDRPRRRGAALVGPRRPADGKQLMDVACKGGHVDVAKLLMERGVIDHVDQGGSTALTGRATHRRGDDSGNVVETRPG